MSLFTRRVANFVLFQFGWWSIVLLAVRNQGHIALAVGCVLLAAHLRFLSYAPRKELIFVILAGGLGLTVDGLALSLPLYRLVSPGPPLWLVGLWLLFPTTLGHSLAWLGSWPRWRQAVLGAVSGPLTYFVGERLGLLVFVTPKALTLAVYGVMWGALLVGLNFLKLRRLRDINV